MNVPVLFSRDLRSHPQTLLNYSPEICRHAALASQIQDIALTSALLPSTVSPVSACHRVLANARHSTTQAADASDMSIPSRCLRPIRLGSSAGKENARAQTDREDNFIPTEEQSCCEQAKEVSSRRYESNPTGKEHKRMERKKEQMKGCGGSGHHLAMLVALTDASLTTFWLSKVEHTLPELGWEYTNGQRQRHERIIPLTCLYMLSVQVAPVLAVIAVATVAAIAVIFTHTSGPAELLAKRPQPFIKNGETHYCIAAVFVNRRQALLTYRLLELWGARVPKL